MRTIKEAAEALLSRNEITQEEFSNLEKTGAFLGDTKNTLKALAGVQEKYFKRTGYRGGKEVMKAVTDKAAIRGLQARDIFKNLGAFVVPVAAAGAGVLAAKELVFDPMRREQEMAESYSQILQTTPALVGEDQEKVRDYFGVVKTFAPNAAANPLVAGALVNKMVQFGGVDHKLVQDMASLQESQKTEGVIPMFMGNVTKGLTGTPKD